MTHASQHLIAVGHLNQFIPRRHQRVVTGTGVILQFHIETGRTAQATDCRRATGDDTGLINMTKGFGGALNNGKGVSGFRIAFAPVFQTYKHTRDVLSVPARA